MSYANDPTFLESYHSYFRHQDEVADDRRELEAEISRLKQVIETKESQMSFLEMQRDFERNAHWACREKIEALEANQYMGNLYADQ